jgi:hypothetical protein
MTGLQLAPGLTLPLEAVTETFAILAKRGSGKTYTAAVLVEELHAAGLPVAVIDPVGVWWGLRSSASGTDTGLPFVVFGGDHADVPLEPTAGQLLADLIVDERLAVVIDLSGLSKSAGRRFMTDFAERLYHRNREPLHLVIDEADAYAPQRTSTDGARLLGAIEDLVRRGRARGIGVTLITQRPAVLNKDVLTQAEVLIALRMTGPRDVAAIDEWVRLHADEDQAAKVKASLPALPVGTAWVWSPGWLGILQQAAIRQRRTYDSSATPKPGQRRPAPERMAQVDLTALGERIAATVERAKADDPKALRARVAELERQLAAERAKPQPEPTVERVEVPVLDDHDRALIAGLSQALISSEQVITHVRDLIATKLPDPEVAHDRQDIPRARPAGDRPEAMERPRPAQRPDRAGGRQPHRPAVQRSAAAADLEAADARLGKGERTILTAIAQYEKTGVTREQLTVLTGYKRSSRDTYLQRLRAASLIDVLGGRLFPLAAAYDVLGPDFEPLPTGQALRDHWLSTLPGGEAVLLEHLIDAYPSGVARDDLSERTGYKRSSRDTYLQRLRARQLITTDGDPRAADTLFDGGSRG